MYGPYKRHFACFACRKGFKRAALARVEDAAADPAPCPDCGTRMADLGLDFKPPRRSAVQHWAVVEFLHRRGFAYHRRTDHRRSPRSWSLSPRRLARPSGGLRWLDTPG